jgi:ankyrin repeat protein
MFSAYLFEDKNKDKIKKQKKQICKAQMPRLAALIAKQGLAGLKQAEQQGIPLNIPNLMSWDDNFLTVIAASTHPERQEMLDYIYQHYLHGRQGSVRNRLSSIYRIIGSIEHAAQLYWAACCNQSKATLQKLMEQERRINDFISPDLENELHSPLYGALRYGHLETVVNLQELGADINLPCSILDSSPIHIAAKYGHLPIVKYFLEQEKLAVDSCDSMGRTPLMLAVISGQLEMVKYLLAQGANIEATENDGYTPILYAINTKNKPMVRLLAANHVNLQETGDGKRSGKRIPFYWSLFNYPPRKSNKLYKKDEFKKFVDLLLELDADINYVTADGRTALIDAVAAGNIDIEIEKIQFLIDRGALINGTEKSPQQLPLIAALHHPHLHYKWERLQPVVECLLANQVDINACSASNHNALMVLIAALFEFENKVNEDAKKASKEKRKPSFSAKEIQSLVQTYIDPINFLIAHGADVNLAFCKFIENKEIREAVYLYGNYQDKIHLNAPCPGSGQTPLMLAMQHAEYVKGQTAFLPGPMITFLLRQGADINACNSKGQTPLMNMLALGNIACAQELIARKDVDIDKTDHAGHTALDYAGKLEDKSIFNELLPRMKKLQPAAPQPKAEQTPAREQEPQVQDISLKHIKKVKQYIEEKQKKRKGWFTRFCHWIKSWWHDFADKEIATAQRYQAFLEHKRDPIAFPPVDWKPEDTKILQQGDLGQLIKELREDSKRNSKKSAQQKGAFHV